MNKTARLITTLDCNRSCHYCCNTPEMISSAKIITDLSELDNYSEVCITGGEPMLYPGGTAEIISYLTYRSNKRRVYLYTADATSGNKYEWLFDMFALDGLSGIHYTLHYDADILELIGLFNIERLSKEFTDKSFRLYLDAEIKHPVTIHPERWSRIESFKFIKDCPLPAHEDLFILRD